MAMIDMVGQRIGKLTVLARAENSKGGSARWLCKCDCGNEKIVRGNNLRSNSNERCKCPWSKRQFKTCPRCKETKPATDEHFFATSRGWCKVCIVLDTTERRRRDPDKERLYSKLRMRARRSKDPEKDRLYGLNWKRKNADRTNALKRERWHSDPVHREKQRAYRKANPQTLQARINTAMRANIYSCIKQNKRGQKWPLLTGYSIDALMAHLEAQFHSGMSWDNYGHGCGAWEIDHKRPVRSFKFSSAEDQEFKECWALENLQPLWTSVNRKKCCTWNGKDARFVEREEAVMRRS